MLESAAKLGSEIVFGMMICTCAHYMKLEDLINIKTKILNENMDWYRIAFWGAMNTGSTDDRAKVLQELFKRTKTSTEEALGV